MSVPVIALGLFALSPAGAVTPGPATHGDPVAPVLVALVLLLAAAKLGGALFLRLRQPAVLGELVAGVLLGNVLLVWGTTPAAAAASDGFLGGYARLVQQTLATGSPLDILARIGVIVLLFRVGLETDLADMRRVGLSSLLVATVGVIVPFVLGFLVSYRFLPGHHPLLVHVFVGSVLCATSVGITARVFQELGRLNQDEARIVLGAAVIDDVMGLVVLAVVSGVVAAQRPGVSLPAGHVVAILAEAVAFLFLAVVGGRWLAPRVMRLASRLHGEGLLLVTGLTLCFVLAVLADRIGLAPIVGAFAAGLLLEPVHYEEFKARGVEHTMEELLTPLADVLVPLFFVQMGMSVRLETFGQPGVVGFALLLTLAAVAGKQACGLGVVGKHLDRISVGVGMIPRGEVGLIVAAIGRQMMLNGEPLVSDTANSAVVIMVMVTTLITPPMLQWTLRAGELRRAARLGEPRG